MKFEQLETAATLQPIPVAIPQPARLELPLASIACLLLLPLLAGWLRRRRASWPQYLLAGGTIALLAAVVWPLWCIETPVPWAKPAAVTEPQAQAISAALLRNVYAAFAGREETQTYDTLATSVDGPLLSELYLNIRAGLELAEDGGAVASVVRVEFLDGQLESAPDADANADPVSVPERDERGFVCRCRWTIQAVVEHWGHVHLRTNLYEARLTIEPRAGTWKITGVELWDEQLGEIETLREASS